MLALRPLLRRPLLSLAAIATLAVGVGAATTAFTLAHAVLSPLPYPHPDALVRLYDTADELKTSPNPRLAAIWNRLPVSYRNAVDWRQGARSLTAIGLYASATAVLEAGGEPEDVPVSRLDAELLRVLGVPPLLGRAFRSEEVAHHERVALLSHPLWTGAFGGSRTVLGRALRLDGRLYTIVGVMPAGFALPGRQDLLWIPAVPSDDDLTQRDSHAYTAIGRLAPGAAIASARADLQRIAARLAAAYPQTNRGAGVRTEPLLDTVVGDGRHPLVLFSIAALV
ncbi:MAG TPA: ABC transporter permease, partial [Thermoanaerobaculia bacterium]